MSKDKFYISTAIAYTSAKPHIGNTYEIVLADVIARYKRFCGYDVYFQTGTDEHGEKIELKAKEAGVEPQKYVDDIVYSTKTAYEVTVIDYDPDSPMLERMFSLRYCDHDRHYAMDGLNHDVFTLYY